jgi:hypothetical protein
MPFNLQLVEFTDREFLFVLDDALDAGGYANARQIQDVLQLDHPEPTRCIGSRCAWLRRLGVVDYDRNQPRGATTRWTITEEGRGYMNGELSKELQKLLDDRSPARSVMVLRQLREEYEGADNTKAGMMRREWRTGELRRKRG